MNTQSIKLLFVAFIFFFTSFKLAAMDLRGFHHDAPIVGLVQLSNGNLASIDLGFRKSHRIAIWDYSTGERLRIFDAHDKNIDSIVRLCDGSIVTCSWDNTIKIWDQSLEHCLQTLVGHTERVHQVIELDAKRLASVSWDETVKIWDRKTGNVIKTFDHNQGEYSCILVRHIVAINNGRQLLSVDECGTVRFWNIDTGECEIIFPEDRNFKQVNVIFQAQNGYLVLGCDDGIIRFIDPRSMNCVKILKANSASINSLIEVRSGEFVSGDSESAILVWNIKKNKISKSFMSDIGSITSLYQLSDGNLASAACKKIEIWSLA